MGMIFLKKFYIICEAIRGNGAVASTVVTTLE